MLQRSLKFLCLLVAFWVFSLGGNVVAKTTVFQYKVRWLGLTAGEIRIEIRQKGEETYVKATSQTVGMVRIFYPFQSSWETWLGPDGHPRRSRLWRKKGKREVSKEFIFDQEKGLVKRIYRGKVRTDVVGRKVHDELSAFVSGAGIEWEQPGDTRVFWIYAHGKARKAILTYLKDEELKTGCGSVKTRKIRADFGFRSEIVKRARRAVFWWWHGQMLKAEGDMPIGHLTAILSNPRCEP